MIGLVHAGRLHAEDLPLIGGGTTYSAAVHRGRRAEAGRRGPRRRRQGRQGHRRRPGRRPGPGRRSGSTRAPSSATETGAAIRIKTLLGQKFLALEPGRAGAARPGTEIPLRPHASRRTTWSRRSATWPTPSSEIDTDQLAQSLDTSRRHLPEHARRGAGLAERPVAAVADDRRRATSSCSSCCSAHAAWSPRCWPTATRSSSKLIQDGNLLLQEMRKRGGRDPPRCSSATAKLSAQLTGLVDDNRKHLAPALEQLNAVVADPAERNQDALDAQHRAAGAVLPGVRQHPRQRPLVRHLHRRTCPVPEIPRRRVPTRAAADPAEVAADASIDRRSAAGRDRRGRWCSLAVSVVSLLAAPARVDARRRTSRAPSASTRARTCGCSACRSARSRASTPAGRDRAGEVLVRPPSTRCRPTRKAVDRRRRRSWPTGTCSSRPPTPAGDVMADGAVIPLDRTAVPLELDQIYQSLERPVRRARPEGRERRRRAVAAAGRLGGEPERPGREAEPDHHRRVAR